MVNIFQFFKCIYVRIWIFLIMNSLRNSKLEIQNANCESLLVIEESFKTDHVDFRECSPPKRVRSDFLYVFASLAALWARCDTSIYSTYAFIAPGLSADSLFLEERPYIDIPHYVPTFEHVKLKLPKYFVIGVEFQINACMS